jgi:hypothetical protein
MSGNENREKPIGIPFNSNRKPLSFKRIRKKPRIEYSKCLSVTLKIKFET